MSAKPVVIWQVYDDKPGHRNQLRGLSNALAEIAAVEVCEVPAPSKTSAIVGLFAKKFVHGAQLPRPDIILGAGHSTHFGVLAARRTYGGKAVVLMKPSLPIGLFDLCIVPEHDVVPDSESVVRTRGVLNVVRPSMSQNERTGLMLIGGPSAAYGWSDERIVEQVSRVASGSPDVIWSLTTSRRTPSSFLKRLSERALQNLQAVCHEQTPPTWVPGQLVHASQVWVSEDSVSMVYEALTSGAAVGLFDVPHESYGRVAAGVDALVQTDWLSRFSQWSPGTRLRRPPERLDEARRCAEIMLSRFSLIAAA
ncbi:MAG: mitochondrial fission ELM1 family protein [Planctomycetota bacterium]